MLDTLALSFEQRHFKVLDYDRFIPSARGLYEPPYYPLAGGRFKCTQHPTATDLKCGNYKPRLTLTKRPQSGRGFGLMLRVEFSAPKLMRGNNLMELGPTDFGNLLACLHIKLRSMGVDITYAVLKDASVTAIHYSKNIPLTDGTRCFMVIDELRKHKLSSRLDNSQSDWRNGGSGVKYHCNGYEVAFYDKLQDMRAAALSPKRSMDYERSPQLNLFNIKGNIPPSTDILRFEVRLNDRKKLAALLAELGMAMPLTLGNLYCQQVAKGVLQHYWQSLTPAGGVLDILQTDSQSPSLLAEDILAANPNASPTKICATIGTTMLLKQIGVDGLNNLFSKHERRKITRLLDETAQHLPRIGTRWSVLGVVSQQLADFKPILFKSSPNGVNMNPSIRM